MSGWTKASLHDKVKFSDAGDDEQENSALTTWSPYKKYVQVAISRTIDEAPEKPKFDKVKKDGLAKALWTMAGKATELTPGMTELYGKGEKEFHSEVVKVAGSKWHGKAAKKMKKEAVSKKRTAALGAAKGGPAAKQPKTGVEVE